MQCLLQLLAQDLFSISSSCIKKKWAHLWEYIRKKKKRKQAVISIVFFLEIMKKRKIQDILGEMNLLKEQETIAYNANNPISFA